MAKGPFIIDTGTALVADRTQVLSHTGAHGAATFYLDLTAITRTTGTLDVTLRWISQDGNTVAIAAITGLTGTGLSRLVLTAGEFDLTRQCIPEPNQVFWDLVGDTTAVTGNIYASYGD